MRNLFAFSFVAVACFASAQEETKIDVSFDSKLASKYVWRGINAVNNWVLQPSVTAGAKGFSVNLWGNMELTNHNRNLYGNRPAGKFTEWDLTLDYTHDFGAWTGSAGWIDYQFPNTGAQRFQEWYVAAGCKQDWNPKVAIYFPTKKQMGTYASLSVAHDFDAVAGLGAPLKFSAWLGWVDKKASTFYYGASKSTLADFGACLAFDHALGDGWTLTPSLTYTNLADKALLAGANNRQNVVLAFSVNKKF